MTVPISLSSAAESENGAVFVIQVFLQISTYFAGATVLLIVALAVPEKAGVNAGEQTLMVPPVVTAV